MAEVRLEKLTKRFGKTEVLAGFDLTIHHGEFFTFVGPSGCGKSTLLHLIAGLDTLTSGEVYFDGQAVSGLSPKERDVAIVFQSYALYPHMTAYDNLAFPLRMKKHSQAEIDKQVQRVAELLDLSPFISRKPRELSGGQRQRVALGRAMVRNPRLFLLDEPLSNLDAQLRLEMRSEIKKLHRVLKATMIYVTHDQVEAMTLSDRIAVLHRGVLQQCGTPKEVYEQPSNLFVAGFVGHPPMNLIDGKVSADGSSVQLEAEIRHPFSSLIKERTRQKLAGRSVVVGVRPEHIKVQRSKTEAAIRAELDLIERMGSEVWLEMTLGDRRLRAKAPADFDGTAGERFQIGIDETLMHFFDPATGFRIF